MVCTINSIKSEELGTNFHIGSKISAKIKIYVLTRAQSVIEHPVPKKHKLEFQRVTLSKKNLLSHLYWGTQWTMEIS